MNPKNPDPTLLPSRVDPMAWLRVQLGVALIGVVGCAAEPPDELAASREAPHDVGRGDPEEPAEEDIGVSAQELIACTAEHAHGGDLFEATYLPSTRSDGALVPFMVPADLTLAEICP